MANMEREKSANSAPLTSELFITNACMHLAFSCAICLILALEEFKESRRYVLCRCQFRRSAFIVLVSDGFQGYNPFLHRVSMASERFIDDGFSVPCKIGSGYSPRPCDLRLMRPVASCRVVGRLPLREA